MNGKYWNIRKQSITKKIIQYHNLGVDDFVNARKKTLSIKDVR